MATQPPLLQRAPITTADGELLTATEVAQRFNISRKTVYRQLSAGTFPIPAVRVGQQWRFRAADVDRAFEFIDRR
jgi:excisionase family DNA binding protein